MRQRVNAACPDITPALHRKVVEEGFTRNSRDLRYKTYPMTILRGGVGKSTMSFNLS